MIGKWNYSKHTAASDNHEAAAFNGGGHMQKVLILDYIPKAKGRPRMGKFGVYTPKATRDSENAIAAEWRRIHGAAMWEKTAVTVCVFLSVPMPASWSKKKKALAHLKPCVSRPDIDNTLKTVLDALNGIAYADDAQVFSVSASKFYGDAASTEIQVAARTEEKWTA